eukprot:TRINITY_DN17765_c0_g1_i1.p2 TRINITY_DN17765_c0_g1~~TRINITY_DN17765_c0_g1_i1.p2  ORF type:complete len:116 (+),score=35.30 TRINITY_DN17765_c0_g1_i1:27-374(+)
MSLSEKDKREARELAASLKGPVSQKFVESGEKERLKELLRARLVESGWRDDMIALCKTKIEQRGVDNVTVEWLVGQLTPQGRASVPASVKADLLVRIRKFLAANMSNLPQSAKDK